MYVLPAPQDHCQLFRGGESPGIFTGSLSRFQESLSKSREYDFCQHLAGDASAWHLLTTARIYDRFAANFERDSV
jgi:hypothetical protein